MKLLGKAVEKLLEDFADGRVYYRRADQEAPAPYIVFQRTDRENWRDINGPAGMAQAYVQVDVYAAGAFEADALAKVVENTLDGFRGMVYYQDQDGENSIRIGGISLQSDAELVDQTDEPVLYRNTMSYLITYEQ